MLRIKHPIPKVIQGVYHNYSHNIERLIVRKAGILQGPMNIAGDGTH